ncbi:hypothetical protein JCM5350_002075, partial [Sporobolomyces pararoseus]
TEGGLWNRVKPDTPGTDSSAPSSIPDTIVTSPPRPEHFATRKECLSDYFSHFSKYAPPPSSRSSTQHYPLVKTRTSISQDVQDHSRWMFENEMWETVVWSKSSEGDEGNLDGEDLGELSAEEEAMLEKGDYDSFLEGLSDDEVEELMQSLDEMIDQESESESESEMEGSIFQDGVQEGQVGSTTTASRSHEEL